MHSAAVGHPTDIGKYIGRAAPGLEIIGAMYVLGNRTDETAAKLQQIAQNDMNAMVLLRSSYHSDSTQHTERIYVVKQKLWFCVIHLNHSEGLGTLVSMSDNKGLALHCIDVMAEKLALPKGEAIAEGALGRLEYFMADLAMEAIITVPKTRYLLMLE